MKDQRPPLSSDARRVITAQALRAFAYGFGALLLGSTLKHLGYNSTEVGLVLGALVAGTILTSVGVARWSDRLGRRRCYVALYVALAASGAVFSYSHNLILLVLVALTGTLSTDIVDNGPFTSLEQAMLATELSRRESIRGFGLYNAIATAAGSLGALAAGGPTALRHFFPALPINQRFFLLFVPVALAGAIVAWSLSPKIEAPTRVPASSVRQRLGPSRPIITRLAALFAVDSFGGGFVVQAFIAYWFSAKFHTSLGVLGIVFFAAGVLQTFSSVAAVRIAERFGLLSTMVFTHLPSNVLLAAIAFVPSFPVAIALYLLNSVLENMDVPTRQAYVMALVAPEERTAAAGYTNTARYLVRPFGPLLAGAGQGLFFGLPFLVAGTIKGTYDLVLWRWFRGVDLPEQAAAEAIESETSTNTSS